MHAEDLGLTRVIRRVRRRDQMLPCLLAGYVDFDEACIVAQFGRGTYNVVILLGEGDCDRLDMIKLLVSLVC